MAAEAVKLAVKDSGTVAAPSHRLHGDSVANARAISDDSREAPVIRSAT